MKVNLSPELAQMSFYEVLAEKTGQDRSMGNVMIDLMGTTLNVHQAQLDFINNRFRPIREGRRFTSEVVYSPEGEQDPALRSLRKDFYSDFQALSEIPPYKNAIDAFTVLGMYGITPNIVSLLDKVAQKPILEALKNQGFGAFIDKRTPTFGLPEEGSYFKVLQARSLKALAVFEDDPKMAEATARLGYTTFLIMEDENTKYDEDLERERVLFPQPSLYQAAITFVGRFKYFRAASQYYRQQQRLST